MIRDSICMALVGLAAVAGCRSAGTTRRVVLTDRAPAPIGPYSQAVVEGDFVFVAGQGPIDPATGKYVPGEIRSEARLALENIKAILEAAGTSLEKVVKVNVYLRDMKDFPVVNEVYAQYFKQPAPARATIQAGALPLGMGIEIECVAAR